MEELLCREAFSLGSWGGGLLLDRDNEQARAFPSPEGGVRRFLWLKKKKKKENSFSRCVWLDRGVGRNS